VNPAAIIRGAERALLTARLVAAAIVIGLFALGFLSLALYLYLADHMTSPAAAAVTGLVLAALALLVLIIARRKPATGIAVGTDDLVGRMQAIQDLGTAARLEIAANAPNLTLAALAAGCALGYSPHLRRLLREFTR
jgi:hypothetical protein